MIGERFAAFRTSRGADPALSAVSVAEARAFVVSLQEAGLAPSSVAGFVRGLRAFSAWCAAEGLVAESVDDWRPVLSGPMPASARLTRPDFGAPGVPA